MSFKKDGTCMFHPQIRMEPVCKLCNSAPPQCTKCNDQSVCSRCCCCGHLGVQFGKCDGEQCKGFYTMCLECFTKFYGYTRSVLNFSECYKMVHVCKRFFEKPGSKWVSYGNTLADIPKRPMTAEEIVENNPTIAALLSENHQL